MRYLEQKRDSIGQFATGKVWRYTCDSCNLLRINGVVCHEVGCPEAWRDRTVKCAWCDAPFEPEERCQKCCSHTCECDYSGIACDCEECNPDSQETLE